MAPKTFFAINNIKLREISCSLELGTIPRDIERLGALSFISTYKYAMDQHLAEPILELCDPSTDETVVLETLHSVWETHAKKKYLENWTGVQQKMDAVTHSLNPFFYVYDPTLAIRILAQHHTCVAKYQCRGCKDRYFARINRMRCESSHPISKNGTLSSTRSEYSRDGLASWWDSLPVEDRVGIVGAEAIYHDLKNPVYLHVDRLNGETIVDILQGQLEGTALVRQIHQIPQKPVETVMISPHHIANRMIYLFSIWCKETLLTMEQSEFLKQRRRQLSKLIKKSVLSDRAFRQLTEFADNIQWTEEEEQEESMSSGLERLQITSQ